MDQILDECEGCIGIADDITVHGHTEAEYDDITVSDCVQSEENTCQSPNCEILGCLYDGSGLHPDAVHALPTPTNVTELQEFLGMVMQLSPFIPGLSTLTSPLHELLKKDAEFNQDASYQATFQCVEDAVASDTTLQYFDASWPITVQVDA